MWISFPLVLADEGDRYEAEPVTFELLAIAGDSVEARGMSDEHGREITSGRHEVAGVFDVPIQPWLTLRMQRGANDNPMRGLFRQPSRGVLGVVRGKVHRAVAR